MTTAVDKVRTVIQQELTRLRRFAYSLTGNKADADDLVQNLAVRLLKTGLPEDVDPVPWMLRICKNLWIDELRSREVRMKATNNDQLQTPSLTDGERSSRYQVDAGKVLKAMTSLSDNQRIALSLVAIEGMSYAQVAEILEVPIGTIMSRVARARDNLAKRFRGEVEELIQ